jgi:ATP-dependent RNA helicase DeaD
MPDLDLAAILGPELAGALAGRGFTELTTVQEAVLDPAVTHRDLRMTSQTGSGKTVALGFALRDLVVGDVSPVSGAAHPRALVVAPTRELAHQVEQELTWLYAPLGVRVVTTTGGSSARDERRALATGPAVIVGTPGRLLDHLSRKSIDPSQIAAVVLDEADRMLDLGFREDLTAILGYPPKDHRTHLVSATFPHAVRALADSVQDDPVHVEGTRLGAANVDIVHRIVLVDPKEKVGAVMNILLVRPEDQALVFARTRADVASLAKELHAAKFTVGSLSGEMDQVARNRAMSAFKKGTLRVLVATDVAARGIDVQDIAHVIHADPPGDSDTYTHRSGRTGRAGRKGMSTVLVTPTQLRGVSYMMSRAGVRFSVEPVPSAESIRDASDERMFRELTADAGVAEEVPERVTKLAARLATSPEATRVLTRLLSRVRSAEACEPLDLRRIEPPSERPRTNHESARPARDLPRAPTPGKPLPRPSRDMSRAPGQPAPAERFADRQRAGGPPRTRDDERREWASFRVTWGADQGADARRLLAIVCRRGGIRGSDVGAIRVGSHSSTVDVAASVSGDFAVAVAVPDPREPNVVITPNRAGPVDEVPRAARPETERPPPPRSGGYKGPRPTHTAHGAKPAPAAHTPHYKPTTPQGARPAAHRPAPPRAHDDGFKGDRYKPSARGEHASAPHRPSSGEKPMGGGYKGKRERPPATRGHAPPRRGKA